MRKFTGALAGAALAIGMLAGPAGATHNIASSCSGTYDPDARTCTVSQALGSEQLGQSGNVKFTYQTTVSTFELDGTGGGHGGNGDWVFSSSSTTSCVQNKSKSCP